MKISRFAFSNKEKNNRETSPTGGCSGPDVPQHFGGSKRSTRRHPGWGLPIGLQTLVSGVTKNEQH
jgi:hypothetical protein